MAAGRLTVDAGGRLPVRLNKIDATPSRALRVTSAQGRDSAASSHSPRPSVMAPPRGRSAMSPWLHSVELLLFGKVLVTLFILLTSLTAAACGGNGSSAPTRPSDDPSSPPPASTACRTYPTSGTIETLVTEAGQLRYRANYTVSTSFDRTTATLTSSGPMVISVPFSCTLFQTTVTTYGSVADFVDDQKPIGKTRIQKLETTTGDCSSGQESFEQSYSYDSQQRLTRISTVSSAGSSIAAYSAWDTSGRPTSGTESPPACVSPVTITYNDAARTVTDIKQCSVLGSHISITTTTTYSNDFNFVSAKGSGSGSSGETTAVFTVAGTAQVCK